MVCLIVDVLFSRVYGYCVCCPRVAPGVLSKCLFYGLDWHYQFLCLTAVVAGLCDLRFLFHVFE
jgi:hypothetical protein